MSRLKRGSQSQAEACGSSDRSRADVLFGYISSEHPTSISLAALKLCHIPYPMTSYPRYKLTKLEIDIAQKRLFENGRISRDLVKGVCTLPSVLLSLHPPLPSLLLPLLTRKHVLSPPLFYPRIHPS